MHICDILHAAVLLFCTVSFMGPHVDTLLLKMTSHAHAFHVTCMILCYI